MSIPRPNTPLELDPERDYTLSELGILVHLLAERSQQCKTPEKRQKDLHAARNCLARMSFKLADLEMDSWEPRS